MRVMVTGGTGFVGAHTVKALVDAGHEVTMLVRNPDRIDANVKPLGVGHLDYVVGDMTDSEAVGVAMEGCQAALHAAAVVGLDRRRAAEVLAANPRGCRVVMDAAIQRELDPIVYVSSTSALFTPGLTQLHAELPPAVVASAYGQSKAMAEQLVRERQAQGAPITITYPGGVMGPPAGDAVGEVAGGLLPQLKSGTVPLADASWSIIDVRDLARIHAGVMRPGQGPRRYMCAGTYITMNESARILRQITGRRFPVLPIPGAAFRGLGRVMDRVMQVAPIDSVFTLEAMTVLTRWVPSDDHLVHDELGVTYRDPAETYRSALEGLLAAGLVSRRQVGTLAG